MQNEFAILGLLVVCLEVFGAVSYVRHQEVASFRYDWSQASVHEQFGQIVSLGPELIGDSLEVAVRLIESFEFMLETTSHHFLDQRFI